MIEQMQVVSETSDSGRTFHATRYASNGLYKPKFALRATPGQLISDQYKKMKRRAEHSGQLFNRPVYQKTKLPYSVQVKPFDTSDELPGIPEISNNNDHLKNRKIVGGNRTPPEVH